MDRYRLQYKAYGCPWKWMPWDFENCGDAICKASEQAETERYPGLIRVVDTEPTPCKVMIVYSSDGRVGRILH